MYPPLFEAGKVTGYNYIEAKAPKCHKKFKKKVPNCPILFNLIFMMQILQIAFIIHLCIKSSVVLKPNPSIEKSI